MFCRCWQKDALDNIGLPVRMSEPFIAGSAALHQHTASTEKSYPPWSPNDVDFFCPVDGSIPDVAAVTWGAEHSLQWALNHLLPGIIIRCQRSPSYAPYGRPNAEWSIVHINNMELTLPRNFEETTEADLKIMRLSMIPVQRHYTAYGQNILLRPVDVIDGFDLDVCQVAMRVSPKTGGRDFFYGGKERNEEEIKHAIKSRRATMRTDKKKSTKRLTVRQNKYERRGFNVNVLL
jgi:hypothetical protein